MEIKRLALLFFLTLFCVPVFPYTGGSGFFAQTASQGVPVFRYNIFRTLTEDTRKFAINIHADISNDRLQFIKADNFYEGSYSISAAVFAGTGSKDMPLHQISEMNTVTEEEYKETQSPAPGKPHIYKFEADKGLYTVVIILRDLNSNKTHTVRTRVEFDDVSGTIISDLRMVFWQEDENFSESYRPLINNIVDKNSIYTGALFEIQTPFTVPEKFSIRYRIFNTGGTAVYDNSFDGATRERLQYQVLKIPLENLTAGNYTIEAQISMSGKMYKRTSAFFLRWSELSPNVPEINTALEQMLYITDYDSVRHVFDLPEDKKLEWFKEFWNSLEETLSLKNNSLMEEYFRRIAYANMHFSVPKKDGWKTDMGKVLCIMGDPDEVQNYPFVKEQRPYEVWTYYDINTQFIFDYTGGEYRLRK